jgi:uncharacterized protein (TIGR02679 family)
MSCELCAGVCEVADIKPLLAPGLGWLWEQIARAADQRGDESMSTGTLTIRIPTDPGQRSAARGLISDSVLSRKTTKLNLVALTVVLTARHPQLAPGAVAAHAVGRRLAARARQRTARDAASATVAQHLDQKIRTLPPHLGIDPADTVRRLTRTGWIARIRDNPNPTTLIADAFAVLGRLPNPGQSSDRRLLVSGNPHALDAGPLPSLILAIAGVSALPPREAWDELGVKIDDLVGGLIVTGLHPHGWTLPPGVTLTLPPRQLLGIRWAPPTRPGQWAFVTENPSVLAAAIDTYVASPDTAEVEPQLVCTAGTPSVLECIAVAALAAAGWNVAVRADFDASGLMHVRALLSATPTAAPWRMTAADYIHTRADRPPTSLWLDNDASPWDRELVSAMNEHGVPAYEEDQMDLLVNDVLGGRPGVRPESVTDLRGQ